MKKEWLFLLVLSLSSLAFSLFRVYFTNSPFFLFLNWNLVLAAIPWIISMYILRLKNLPKRKFLLLFLSFFWFIFFPNAPYIITDLFHLRVSKAMPIWYDLLMVMMFAWTGLMFGFRSLLHMETAFKKAQIRWTPFYSSLMLIVVSFGIYIGRYMRWNSWDIVSNPNALLLDLHEIFQDPLKFPGAWGMTLAMAIFLNAIYWSMRRMGFEEQGARFEDRGPRID